MELDEESASMSAAVPAPDPLGAGVLAGERRALARAITLVESTRREHRQRAAALLAELAPRTGRSLRIGISGVPGAGKSTLIEALGTWLLGHAHRLAVLAVDPSSSVSGGSILGDKTRMPRLATEPRAFIRPSPAGRTLGGVAGRTRESVLLVEAAGHDLVFVETVGIGQSETAVANMTDIFVLLLAPGAGDELQGIKRGVMELADIVLVNKADGELADAAGRAAADYANALRLLRPRVPGWQVPVLTCSAREGRGIDTLWEQVQSLQTHLAASGELARRRAQQALAWMWTEASDGLLEALRADERVRARLADIEAAVQGGELPPTVAAERLLAAFLKQTRRP